VPHFARFTSESAGAVACSDGVDCECLRLDVQKRLHHVGDRPKKFAPAASASAFKARNSGGSSGGRDTSVSRSAARRERRRQRSDAAARLA